MSREVTLRQNETSTTDASTRYVSIFEDPARFGAQLKVAEMLSRTQFVPKAFQGRPEDCLVALDMAGRLDLNPLAVFPDIYVIDGRSSFSSKFLIALVNRSGRFTRIQFETGVDGNADVTFGAWENGSRVPRKIKKTVPNVYAVASFADVSSGERYESPRVDMNFAERNGWIEKPGSKWQTMPEIMTRYRAASILIKSVCPEIVMGLEFSDDLLDARDDASPRPVVLETPKQARRALPAVNVVAPAPETIDVTDVQDDDALSVDELEALLRGAVDVGALTAAANVVASYELDKDDAERLRQAYRERRDELASGAVIPPKTGLNGEHVFNANAAFQAIENATTPERLDTIRKDVEAATNDGRLDVQDANELYDALDRKRGDVAPETPTDEQLRYAENLRSAMVEAAKDLDDVKLDANGQLINDWTEQGILTSQQGRELYAQFEELRKELVHG